MKNLSEELIDMVLVEILCNWIDYSRRSTRKKNRYFKARMEIWTREVTLREEGSELWWETAWVSRERRRFKHFIRSQYRIGRLYRDRQRTRRRYRKEVKVVHLDILDRRIGGVEGFWLDIQNHTDQSLVHFWSWTFLEVRHMIIGSYQWKYVKIERNVLNVLIFYLEKELYHVHGRRWTYIRFRFCIIKI